MLIRPYMSSEGPAIVCALWLLHSNRLNMLRSGAAEAALTAGRNTDSCKAAFKASSPPIQQCLPTASQLQEVTLGPADSNVSDATQGPSWLQRWAALLMPNESNDQSQASMQQFMTNITVAMQQAQREVSIPFAEFGALPLCLWFKSVLLLILHGLPACIHFM